ncbi:MAG: phosphotransferase, partial [Candidatus Nanohaloarchaea archaeon]|nr:phosphotransferase [Candidatus Nanohaloarchaea archaeon]
MSCSILEPQKTDFDRVAELYGLGDVESVEYIEEGMINSIYDVRAGEGRFMVRMFPKDWGEVDEGERPEFKVLDCLNGQDFQYRVPVPLENPDGGYVSVVGGRSLWVYRRLEGDTVDSLGVGQIREVGKALARYHNAVEGLELERTGDFFNFGWLRDRYEDMRIEDAEEDVDRFMMENVDYMERMIDRIDGLDFRENVVAAHSDFHSYNLLFEGERLVGILDFDNARMRPRIMDVGNAAWHLYIDSKKDLDDGRLQALIDGYESVNSLTEEE